MTDQIMKNKREATRILGLPRNLGVFVIIAFTSVAVYRLFTMEIDLQFDFPSLLSLLLALFAVFLASLFYFKATETSNQFYAKMDSFTAHTSEILGRIEECFGERMASLDKGYTPIRDRLEKPTFDIEEARKKKEEAEKIVEKMLRKQKAL